MSNQRKWAEFKFSVVGPLLTSPPRYGEVTLRLKELAQKQWRHPLSGGPCQFSWKTVESWYYKALKSTHSPVEGLIPKVRSDRGREKVLSQKVKDLLLEEVKKHPSWSKKLHADNLKVIIEKEGLGKVPSYSSIKRYLNSIGYRKVPRRNSRRQGFIDSYNKKQKFEQRSYEHSHIGSLFHLDFHHCSREIVTEKGEIVYPTLFCVIDDCSRLVCHIQWYLLENAENLIHGFIQALQKRGTPRSLMTDNGSAMTSSEFTSGLKALSILHETTLPYSPEQNGKQEVFWGQVEGRLMSMIENKKIITLRELNQMTLAWAEMEYNRKVHSETKSTPLSRYLSFSSVLRKAPDSSELKRAFRRIEKRKVRRSDGTLSLGGKRFEVPERYRHLVSLDVQYSLWDLSNVHILCPDTQKEIAQIRPLNKTANASGERRSKQESLSIETSDEVSPIMMDLLKKYAETGLPPAYNPKDE